MNANPFRILERARWSDVDAAGIVCYGAYLRFFELAEAELFRSVGLPTGTFAERYGIWLVRRRVECVFHRPIRLDDEVEITARVTAIGRTSLQLSFVVRRAGDLQPAADSQYVLVAVDREELRPVVVPGEVRAALAGATPTAAPDRSDNGTAREWSPMFGPEDVLCPATMDAVVGGHRRILDALREFRSMPGMGAGRTDPETLRATVAFLRQEILPFATREEAILPPGSDEQETTAFEHAFVAAEIDALGRAVERIPVEPGNGQVALDSALEIERRLHRIEAILELHAERSEERWLMG